MYYYGGQSDSYEDHLLDSERRLPTERERRRVLPRHHWSKDVLAACQASASARAAVYQHRRKQEYMLPQSGPSWQQVSLAIVNTLLGVGVLGLPEMLRAAGWLGILVMIAAALVTCFTAKMLVWSFHTCNQRKVNADAIGIGFVSTYEQLAEEVSGRKRAAYFTRWVVATECYGYALGCLVLHATNWPLLLQTSERLGVGGGGSLLNTGWERQCVLAAFLCLVLPLTLLRPKPLRQLALLSLASNVLLLLATLAGPLLAGLPESPDLACPRIDSSIAADAVYAHTPVRPAGLGLAAGLALFAFGGQHTSMPEIYFSMAASERSRFDKAVNWGYGSALAFCIAYSASAYFMYGGCVADVFSLNLMHSLPLLGGITTVAVLLNTFCCFSLFLSPVVEIVAHALLPESMLPPGEESNRSDRSSHFVPLTAATLGVRLLLLLLAGFIALGVPRFGMLAGLLGSLSSMLCSVILPVLFYFQVHLLQITLLKRCVAAFIVTAGVVGLVCGVHSSVASFICEEVPFFACSS